MSVVVSNAESQSSGASAPQRSAFAALAKGAKSQAAQHNIVGYCPDELTYLLSRVEISNTGEYVLIDVKSMSGRKDVAWQHGASAPTPHWADVAV